MSSILFLLFPILSRFISFYALTKTNFLLVVIKMSKSKDSAKFAINFLADLCCWLFALISIIYSGQCISRQLYLRQFINEQFQHVAIFPVNWLRVLQLFLTSCSL